MRLDWSSGARVSRVRSVVSAEIEGEIVALDPEKGTYYGLNKIGSRIWNMLETPLGISDICDRLVQEFEIDRVTCEQQTIDLLEQLYAEGLVALS